MSEFSAVPVNICDGISMTTLSVKNTRRSKKEASKAGNSLWTNRLMILVYSLFAFFAVLILAKFFYEPRGRSLPINWWVESAAPGTDSGSNIQSLPFYKRLRIPETIRIFAPVRYSEGDIFVLPRISGNRIRIFIEDRLAGQIGSNDVTGNLWPHFHTFRLPSDFAGKPVIVHLEISGAYDLGIREVPYLIPESGNRRFLFLSRYIISYIYPFSIGSFFLLALLLILYAFVDYRLRNAYLLTAAGILFAAIYVFDFVYRDSSGSLSNYLAIRKALVISSHLSAWFVLAGMEWFVRKQIPLSKFMFVFSLTSIVAVMIQGTLHDLVEISYFFALVIHINFILVLYLAYKNRSRMVIFSLGFFLFTAIYTYLNLAVFHDHIILLQFGFLMAQVGLGLNLMQEYVRVHEDFRRAHRRSLLDPLTGASNRFILQEVSYSPGDFIVLVDLDNFKTINDTMGHDVGDQILKDWVESANENIREKDRIIRFGGDEFVLLMRGLDDFVLNQVMGRIQKAFHKRVAGKPVSFSYGVERIGSSLSDAILRADRNMYERKQKGRNF